MTNPFSKLKVHREDDKQINTTHIQSKIPLLFKEEQNKKIKQKPENKEKDHQPTHEEGFETVGKVS